MLSWTWRVVMYRVFGVFPRRPFHLCLRSYSDLYHGSLEMVCHGTGHLLRITRKMAWLGLISDSSNTWKVDVSMSISTADF